MSVIKSYQINLDISKDIKNNHFSFNQNDTNTAKITVNLTNNKIPVSLTGSTVRFAFLKADGKRVYQNATIVNPTGGIVEVMLNSQVLAVPKRVKAEVELYFDGTQQNAVTRPFEFTVERSILSTEAIQSSNDFPIINTLNQKLADVMNVDLKQLADVGASMNSIKADVTTLDRKTDWIDVRDYGVKGDGTGDDAVGIIAALAMTETLKRKRVIMPDGLYNVGQTIVVPRRIHLDLSKSTFIRPIKDINVIQLKPEAQLTSGVIDTRRFTGRTFTDFTKACIYLDGNDVFSLYNELHQINGIMMLGEDHYYTDQNWTGTGVRFYSGKGANGEAKFISFVNCSQLGIFNFQKGIHLDVDTTIKTNDEWAWVTGCTFDQVNMMNCTQSIVLNGDRGIPRDVGGNIFTNMQIQIEPTSDYAIYCEGSFNRFEGLFWDLHKNPNPSIKFAKSSRFNVVKCAHGYDSPQHFLDEGYDNTIESATNHTPHKRNMAYPLSTPFNPSMLGNQDDYLVRGDLRGYTFTQVSNHTIKYGGNLKELLTMEMETGVTWGAAGTTYDAPIVFEIDLSSDPIWYGAFFGVMGAWNTYPKGVRIEAYDAITSKWEWCHEVDKNSSYPFVVAAPWVGISKCTKIRISLWGTNQPSGTDVQLSRVFAVSGKNEGKAWFPKAGGNVDGKIYTIGGLVMDKRTDDPATAEVGQVWYRTDSSKSPVRVMTSEGVKSFTLQSIPNEYLNIAGAVKNGTTAVIAENTTDYFRITCKNNSDGLIIPMTSAVVGKTYTLVLDVMLLNTVDDVIQVRLYNRTKNTYYNLNLAVTTTALNTKQRITKNFTFTAGSTFAAGDAIELWIVQSWKNNTHDTFEYKVFKDTLAIY
ncbi:tail spike protein [Bacillus phage Staley]|uniref:Tailspike protein n=1 Tax=Bacillus phage Staley TaxID=1406792 RepID=U5PXJ6_9CAUD|nr:tail spike protein [Bacillus phage Staley]AGY48730.1 tailspike protein [Bacillus phage Staley]